MGIGALRRHYEEPSEAPVVAADDPSPAEPADDGGLDLSKLTVAELEALAVEYGVELPKGKKAEIVVFLEEVVQHTPVDPADDGATPSLQD